MNNLNYPFSTEFHPILENNWVRQSLEKQGDVIKVAHGKSISSFALNGKLGGKVKFILGFIYFFSLLFFTIMLFK